MTFPGGAVSLPSELLSSGMSGPHRIQPAEQPVGLTRLSDEALFQFGEDLGKLLLTETRDDCAPELAEYIDLLCLQVEREISRRWF